MSEALLNESAVAVRVRDMRASDSSLRESEILTTLTGEIGEQLQKCVRKAVIAGDASDPEGDTDDTPDTDEPPQTNGDSWRPPSAE